jgi:hypothetical protein
MSAPPPFVAREKASFADLPVPPGLEAFELTPLGKPVVPEAPPIAIEATLGARYLRALVKRVKELRAPK